MAETGILSPDDRVELLDGQIVDMFPVGPFHSGVGTRLQTIFTLAGGERWIVRTRLPVHLSNGSEPQPDLALVKPREDFYTGRHPQAEDVLLLVEVADSSVRFDREEKLPVYAREGVPEYWIVNLVEKVVEVYRQPSSSGAYTTKSRVRGEDEVAPAAFPAAKIKVAELLKILPGY